MNGRILFGAALLAATTFAPPAVAGAWDDTLARASDTTVYWNAWGGDERTNAFIAWVGGEVEQRYGVTLRHVKLADTAEAVTRVLAEKAAGKDNGGAVDLIWINGANFLSMKEQGLLFGPFAETLPNYRYVDTVDKPSNVVDFTVLVDGMESPWRMAQIVFAYDTERLTDIPRSIPAFLDWAARHPGRFTHPGVRDFLGATFLKQALYELAPDPGVLQQPATDGNFAAVTAPLWAWYDRLRPMLWRGGSQFPDNGPAARQLLDDSEIDLTISFDPAEPAGWIEAGLAPASVRAYTLDNGTIGNTSFVAIPYNAANKDGAMVVADFLLDPATQAHAQDIRVLGSFSVLDLDKLDDEQRQAFEDLPTSPALPGNKDLGKVLLEPHPSWMTRIVDEWTRRYTR
ncbi:MAG: ABC transporter substrate-binding protein [Bauldia sp.]|nr:ABC transporter substrate-binding protein [Bauldia sp.]